ncbi:MAG: 7-cyano-7-deazaguanine synthase [Thermodesulfobacteriota bacterium]
MYSQQMSSEVSQREVVPNRKAVALFSGGLDSALAVRLVKDQGIEVTAIHFTSFFSPTGVDREDSAVSALARELGVPLVFLSRGETFVEIVRNPRYGHGKNMNPCVDCRIHTFRKAKAYMEQIGASFMVTGEVVGQRPMSQRKHTIRFIEKQAECDGIVLRPLSAKLMPQTLVETEGIVDRNRLLDISGRGRKVQLRLAKELGITGYSSPAGGCLLTEVTYSRRLKDLFEDGSDLSPADLEALKVGRHIRVRPGLKLVVARNERENYLLESVGLAGPKFLPVEFPGPTAIAVGNPSAEEKLLIASVIRRYSKESARGEWIEVDDPATGTDRVRTQDVAGEDWIAAHMV